MFCKHSWKMLSETITESRLEHTVKQLRGAITTRLSGRMSDASRKHIQVFTCEKCGKMRRFVEKI